MPLMPIFFRLASQLIRRALLVYLSCITQEFLHLISLAQWQTVEFNTLLHSFHPGFNSWRKLFTFLFFSFQSANDNYDKEKEEYYGLTINSNGNVGWFYPTIFKSSCTIDVTYFPFDDQVYTLKVKSMRTCTVIFTIVLATWGAYFFFVKPSWTKLKLPFNNGEVFPKIKWPTDQKLILASLPKKTGSWRSVQMVRIAKIRCHCPNWKEHLKGFDF